MKIWITKYALTDGITCFEDAEQIKPGMVRYVAGAYSQYAHGNDWHASEDAAKTDAEARRVKKLASLRKQIAKLETLAF